MNWVVYLFGSGLVFFFGVAVICCGLVLASLTKPRWLVRSTNVVAIVGLLLVALSAAPLPYWYYFVATAATVTWFIFEQASSVLYVRRRRLFCIGVIAVWLGGVLMELPYQLAPSIRTPDRPKLCVLGDSVTAGMGENDLETWPNLLARNHNVQVQDCSRPGATTRSALLQADELSAPAGLVLLEIGGNDLLSTTSVSDFEQSLDQLLTKVCLPEREVLMFELPLPPLKNEFGRVQRRLAAQHGVSLIPKRIFIGVLATEGATVDSIHLSQRGRERMADMVWSLVAPAYRD